MPAYKELLTPKGLKEQDILNKRCLINFFNSPLMRPILAVAFVLLPIIAKAQVCADGGPSYPRIANVYGSMINPYMSQTQLDAAAKYDLLIGYGWGHQSSVASQNQLKLLINKLRQSRGTRPTNIINFDYSAPYISPGGIYSPLPGGSLLLDVNHQQIPGWPGTLMLNLNKPELINYLSDLPNKTKSTNVGINGSFVDCLGPFFDNWACRIETGQPCLSDYNNDGIADSLTELNQIWREKKLSLTRATRERIGNNWALMANGAGRENAEYLNGILLEDSLNYVMDGEAAWEQAFEEYRFWSRNTVKPTLTTLVASSGLDVPINIQEAAPEVQNALQAKGKSLEHRMRFNLGTALLEDGYAAYDLHTNWRGQDWWYPEYSANLGCPKGASDKLESGLWSREFDNGLVYVNPSPFDVLVKSSNTTTNVTREKTICPNKKSNSYRTTCSKAAKKKRLKSCDLQFSNARKAARRAGQIWSGELKQQASSARNVCINEAVKKCRCHQESFSETVPAMWRDTTTNEIGIEFMIPYGDARIILKDPNPAQPPTKPGPSEQITAEIDQERIIERNGTIHLQSRSGVEVRMSDTGELIETLYKGVPLLGKGKFTIAEFSDWRPFGSRSATNSKSGTEATFNATLRAPDGRKIFQTSHAELNAGSIELSYSMHSDSSIAPYVNRYELCLNADNLRGTTISTDNGDIAISVVPPSNSFLRSEVASLNFEGLNISFGAPVSIFDGRTWGQPCIFAFHSFSGAISTAQQDNFSLSFSSHNQLN